MKIKNLILPLLLIISLCNNCCCQTKSPNQNDPRVRTIVDSSRINWPEIDSKLLCKRLKEINKICKKEIVPLKLQSSEWIVKTFVIYMGKDGNVKDIYVEQGCCKLEKTVEEVKKLVKSVKWTNKITEVENFSLGVRIRNYGFESIVLRAENYRPKEICNCLH